MKISYGEWMKFGAVYGFITSAIVFGIATLAGGIFGGELAALVIGGIGVIGIIIAVIGGAITWAINGFIYSIIGKAIQRFAVWIQLSILGLISNIITILFSGSNGLTYIVLLLFLIVLSSWIIIFISGIFKLKIPVKKVGR